LLITRALSGSSDQSAAQMAAHFECILDVFLPERGDLPAPPSQWNEQPLTC
jgi:hypothetical protein